MRWLSAREDDACRALRGDQLRFQRSVVKLEQQAFRPALVELTAAVTLLEQAVATTGAVELVVTLEHARPLLVDLENTVVQLDRAYRVPATARCAFCGCSSQHGRRMIPGLGDAVI